MLYRTDMGLRRSQWFGRLIGARRAKPAVIAGLALLVIFGSVAWWKGSGPQMVVPKTAASASELEFTTFSPPTVMTVSYRYDNGHLTLGVPHIVARLRGADGIAYTPSGGLVIGGQATGDVFLISTPGAPVQSVPSGGPAAYMVTVDPSGTALYTAGLPGELERVPLSPPSRGTIVPLHGPDTAVAGIAFGPGGQVLYTSSSPAGKGDIGLLNLANGSTQRLFSDVEGAHGILYDPYIRAYLVMGGNTVLQLPAANPGRVESELTVPGMQFDQGAVNAQGQAFLASNTGALVMVDYARTGRIGDVNNVVQIKHLAPALDDVAPLVGSGARPVATNTAEWRHVADASLGLAAAGFVIVIRPPVAGFIRQRRRKLPRWDRRRTSRRVDL